MEKKRPADAPNLSNTMKAVKQTHFKKYTPNQKLKAIEIINSDNEYFASKALKIYNKPGQLVPFIYNRAQQEYEKVRQACLKKFGYIRIYVVKARRHGISTKVAGDFYQNTIKAELKGKKCNSLVIAQDDESSTALFDITKAYQENAGDLAPRAYTLSKHRLDTANSTYLCATAGKQPKVKGAGKGRGMTLQQAHLSELAHIKNAQTLASSLLLAIGKVPGTEVISESTANGEGDYFHSQYMKAKKGTIDALPFFAPWFWDAGNQSDIPDNFELTLEDKRYQKKHNLTMRQMAWRRIMENSLGLTPEEGKMMFKQEFPGDDEEAFSFSATDSFISSKCVKEALDRDQYKSYGAIAAGFDPSFTNTDKSDRKAFIYRQSANLWGLEYPKLAGHTKMVAYCKDKLDLKTPYIDRLYIDCGGGGYAVFDTLEEDGYGDRIELVNNGKAAMESHKYANKRAEDAARLKEALLDENMPLSISIDEELETAYTTDMTAEGWSEDQYGRLLIEKKEDVKARLGISPEGRDVSGLTFTNKIIRKHVNGPSNHNTKNEVEPLYFEN